MYNEINKLMNEEGSNVEKRFPLQITAVQCTQSRSLRTSDYILLLALSDGISVKGRSAIACGSVVFFSPFSEERLMLQPGCRMICVEIPVEFLETNIGSLKQLCKIFPSADTLIEMIIELFDLQHNQTCANYLDGQIAALKLLKELSQYIDKKTEPSGSQTVAEVGVDGISDYLWRHFREQVQLNDLSQAFHLSKQYISAFFHKKFGMTISTYLQLLRREEAEYLLLSSDLTLTEISIRSGFPSTRAMNQAFEAQYQCSAKEYRTQNRTTFPEDEGSVVLKDISMWLRPYRMMFTNSRAALHQTNIVSTTDPIPFRQVWRDIINIDVPSECLYASTQERLQKVQEQLRFRFARLYNVFRLELIGYIPSTAQYRFTGFISLIDFLKSIGLTPMLVFGQSYEIQSDCIIVNDECYLKTPGDWDEALERLLDVSITRWGRAWVSTWRFEFSMPSQLYGSSDASEFLELFRHSMGQIHRKLPGAQVGGPGIPFDQGHLPRWKSWFGSIVAEEKPDFISAELWANYTIHNSTAMSMSGKIQKRCAVAALNAATGSDILLDVQTIKKMSVDAGMGDAPLYVSAFGITKYQATAAQIGGHCPAHLVKYNIALDDVVEGVGCWKFFNSEPEYPDEYQAIGSGCGIVGRYGLNNPSWYAYYFLSQLLPYKLFLSGNVIVTTDLQDNYSILIHNCKEYSDTFCHHYLKPLAQQFDDHRLYVNNSSLTQTIQLRDVCPQEYLVKQRLIGDRHGCVPFVLKQMGVVTQFGENEINYISGQSLPYMHTFIVEERSDLSVTATLQPNEVMLLQISPKTKK